MARICPGATLVLNPDPNLRVTTIAQPQRIGCAIVVTRRLGSGFETSATQEQHDVSACGYVVTA